MKHEEHTIVPWPGQNLRAQDNFGRLCLEANTSTLLAWITQAEKPEYQATIYAILNQRQMGTLIKSSHNIEWLTKWLIALTIILSLLTVVLAADIVLKYVPERLPVIAPQTPVPPSR